MVAKNLLLAPHQHAGADENHGRLWMGRPL